MLIIRKLFWVSILFFMFVSIGNAIDQMKIGMSGDLVMLDPQLAQTGLDWTPAALIWNRLVEYDNTMMDPIPSIAESWEVSEDGKVWTFKFVKE